MNYQDSLKERIKELECLYDISTKISQSTDIKSVAPFICSRLTKAFQFPNIAKASITILDQVYGDNISSSNHALIRETIIYQQEVIGQIKVYYVTTDPHAHSFLIEEKKLLNKVAQELSFLHEREKRSEQEALLNEIVRRQERLTVLGEMTAGVAHEINTPLGNVIGFSEFIINSSKEKSTVRDAQKIMQSALHAREIVKKLMLFSCDIPQKLSVTKLYPLMKEAIALLSPLLKQHNITIQFNAQDKSASCLIDKVQFTQVIFNLLNNAIQASQARDKIILNLSTNKEFATILIQDFGCGIPSEIEDKIFEPFFSKRKNGTGNGLGLSVVHGIIKKHKGRIQFSSQPNVGTTFVISIPQHPHES